MSKKRKLKKEELDYVQTRARWELRLALLKTIEKFKPEDVNFVKFTNNDIIHVLSSMITRRCEN